MKARTTRYSTALTIHMVNAVNKPQDMEWSNAKNTSAKCAKNQLQDTIGGVAMRRALINRDQSQELPKERYRAIKFNPHSIVLFSPSRLNFLIYAHDSGKESTCTL